MSPDIDPDTLQTAPTAPGAPSDNAGQISTHQPYETPADAAMATNAADHSHSQPVNWAATESNVSNSTITANDQTQDEKSTAATDDAEHADQPTSQDQIKTEDYGDMDHANDLPDQGAGPIGRSRYVSDEAVRDAVIAVFKSGRTPSVRTVRDMLQNRGSSDRIQRAIEDWKRNRQSAAASSLDMPEAPPEVVDLMTKLWTTCTAAADEAARERLADMEADLRNEARRLNERISAANEKVLEAQKETTHATARADALSEQIALLRSHIQKQDERISQMAQANQDLQATIVSGREALAAAHADQDRLRAEHDAALLQMQGQVKSAMEQTEQLRAEMKTERQEMMARSERLQHQLDEARNALTSATIRAATLETERNMLKSQLESK